MKGFSAKLTEKQSEEGTGPGLSLKIETFQRRAEDWGQGWGIRRGGVP